MQTGDKSELAVACLECQPKMPAVVPSLLADFLGLPTQKCNGLAAIGHEGGSLEERLAQVIVQAEQIFRTATQLQWKLTLSGFPIIRLASLILPCPKETLTQLLQSSECTGVNYL